jgi:1-acyl-sn-glycerol-3-phosphate acyltransferase
LGNGIPTISYNLKYGGSVLIDRKDPVQATAEIAKVARYISETNRSVVIFPEGTRSRSGEPKKFYRKGLLTLFEHAPDAWVLPVSVNHSWKLQRFGMFPIPMFVRLQFRVHPAIKVSTYPSEELITLVESTIKAEIVSA